MKSHRNSALDVLRGLVIILMALDHARAFIAPAGLSPENLDTTTIPFFVSRWVTHLCAPTFVFLMGAGIGLKRARASDGMTTYLLSRGLWIVFLEVTWITFSFYWNLNQTYLGVLWALGGSMVILSLLWRIPSREMIGGGIALTILLNLWQPKGGDIPVIGFGFAPHGFSIMGHPVHASYALIPWLAVAMVGVGVGPWLTRAKPWTLAFAGISMWGGFGILRSLRLGDPGTWESAQRGWMFTAADFLNPSKYPPSLAFLLLTLGTAMLILAGPARGQGMLARWLSMFGRVPMFFYLLHLPLAHGLGNAWAWAMHSEARVPAGTPLSMAVIAMSWACVVVLLWPACAYWRRLKDERRDRKWLAYL